MDQALRRFYGLSRPLFGAVLRPEQYFRSGALDALIDDVVTELCLGRVVTEIKGDQGAGKTSLMRMLALTLESQGLLAVTVARAPRTVLELQRMIAQAAALASDDSATPDEFLRALLTKRRLDRLVLLVDEADGLSDALFHYLWLLTQPFRFDATQVSLVLLGGLGYWGEVGEMGSGSRRRAAIGSHVLLPLNDDEAVAFLDHRMRYAGRPLRRVMSGSAVEEVLAYAEGCPGRLEAWTAFALIEGYRKRRRRLGRQDVLDALHADSGNAPSAGRTAMRSVTSLAMPLTVVAAVGVTALLAWRGLPEQRAELPARPEPPAIVAQQPPAPPTEPVPAPTQTASAPTPPARELPPEPPLITAERSLDPRPPSQFDPTQALTAEEPPRRRGGPGLVLVAGTGDSMTTLYAKVYRGVKPPPYTVVLAANPTPVKPGSLVVFPEPPDGWSPH